MTSPVGTSPARMRKPDPGGEAARAVGDRRIVEVSLDMDATPSEVMDVLADGWLFASWVVGASHIRAVDPGWPCRGTRIHHAVGAWPLLVKDSTECLEFDPRRRLVLRARAWPIGEALVSIDVHPRGGGCTVVMGESALRGPALMIRPLEPALLVPRNRESLHRLAAISRGRALTKENAACRP